MKSACLRRDAYLARVLEKELDWLDEEVSISNSQASYDFVFERLGQLNRDLVSLALPPHLTDRLNDICNRKRIVRDAFFNRLFLLLSASPNHIDSLFFSGVRDEWREQVWEEFKHDGTFFQNGFYPLEAMIDPFWAIRSGLELYADAAGQEDYIEPASGNAIKVQRDLAGSISLVDSLYTTVFDQKTSDNHDLLGLNCYMPDWRIPGHDAEQKHRLKLDELLSELKRL